MIFLLTTFLSYTTSHHGACAKKYVRCPVADAHTTVNGQNGLPKYLLTNIGGVGPGQGRASSQRSAGRFGARYRFLLVTESLGPVRSPIIVHPPTSPVVPTY